MSAPIQASASVQVVPASNCVRSSTRIPVRQPGDAGVTSIVDSLSGKKPADAGSGASSSVVALDSAFANEPSRTYPNRSLPVLSEFDYMGDWSRLWRQAAVARSTPRTGRVPPILPIFIDTRSRDDASPVRSVIGRECHDHQDGRNGNDE